MESLKRGNKMTLEDYKKNRKARLQGLSEALDNLPELTDGKAHIEVDAVTGGAKAESEERKKQVKDSFKDKNKETREFIKKQDKDREVDKEDKSENRLMLDESLFEDYGIPKKSGTKLTEASQQVEVLYTYYDGDADVRQFKSLEEAQEFIENAKEEAQNGKTYGGYFEMREPLGKDTYRVLNSSNMTHTGVGGYYESLNEKCGKKLNESLYSDAIDVVDDLVERAKSWIDDGDDKDEAISHAIDDGLIYSDDIFALARYFGGIDDSTLIESFYESLYELMYEKLGDYGREDEQEDEEEEE